jgi:hypothetical protein
MSEEKLERIKALIKEDKIYAFVLDYALFGSVLASKDGNFNTQASIIPNFNEHLAKLVNEGIVVRRSEIRYTGQSEYFEATVDRSSLIELLNDFYEEIKSNMKSLEAEISAHLTDFFFIHEHEGNVSFSVDNYMGEIEHPEVEKTCIELVKKGLMFSWNWITRAHEYRCYKFREQPYNCLQEFKNLMNARTDEFLKAKIEEYLRKENTARLDFLLGLIRTRSMYEVEKYMKERGWSEKLISEVRNELERERMLITNVSSSQFKIIEKHLSEKMDEIDELVQVKKPQELNKLRISLRKEGLMGKTKIEFIDIVKVLEDIITKLQSKGIEILAINKSDNNFEIRLSCNRNLYLIRAEDSEFYSLPSFYADKAVIIGKKILDYTFNQFMEQKSWTNLLLIGYQEHHVLGDVERDALFRYIFEELRRNGIVLIEPVESISAYYAKLTESLKKSTMLNEGFVYTEPYNPWPLQQEFLTLLKSSNNSIKLCVPYPDASTFSFLAAVPKNVSINLLLLSDKKELMERNKVNLGVLNRTILDKRIEVRRNPEIHVRFIICDDKLVMFSSSDLKDSDLKRKYQYGFWTTNEEIVKKAIEYFENVWRNSVTVNLFEELKE